MKKVLFIITFLTAISLIGCKNSDNAGGGKPEEVLSSFISALEKKDIVTAKGLATPESDLVISMLGMQLNDTSSHELEKFDKSRLEIGVANISGDDAKVPVKDKITGSTVNFPLKKINGQWKVAFDPANMMEIGMDQMKSSGANMNSLSDSLSKGMEDLKKMNVDSMMDNVKKVWTA